MSLKHDPKCKIITEVKNYKWRVRSGTTALFWEDSWLTEQPLQYEFPGLYEISNHKLVSVSEFMDLRSSVLSRNLLWKGDPSAQVMSNLGNFDTLLQSVSLSTESDVLIWNPAHGPFSVSKAYTLMFSEMPLSTGNTFWHTIWSLKALPKIKLFLWKVAWGILPTNLILSQRINSISSSCTRCSASSESVHHILWECIWANWAWKFIGKWWSIKDLVRRNKVFSLKFLLHRKWPKFVRQTWQLVVSATLWTVWLARNEWVFNKKSMKQETLKQLILYRVASWGEAANILNCGHDPLWKINPVGALSVRHYNYRITSGPTRKRHMIWFVWLTGHGIMILTVEV